MIWVRVADAATAPAEAVVRPIAADWSAVTPAMRRLDLAAGRAAVEGWARLGELPTGSAVVTEGGALPCRWLVHGVVRSRDEPVSAALVARAVRNSLRRLAEWDVRTAVFVPFGTGAGNLDAERSAELMVPLIAEFMRATPRLAEAAFVTDGPYERDAFQRAVDRAA